MSRVYAYSAGEDVEKNIKKLLNDLDWKKKIKKDSSVFLKVNMSLDSFYPGANSSKEFVGPLVELLSNRAERVFVGDSDPSAGSCDKALRITGVGRAVIDAGGVLVNLSRQPLKRVSRKDCLYFKKGAMLPRVLVDSDVLISSACVKTHIFTDITCSIKNLFGCLPGRKVLYHPWLDNVISDVFYLLRPDFAITDGLVGMEGTGPVEGSPVPLNLVFGSRDLVSNDSFASSLMGFNPERIRHLSLSASRGLGELSFSPNYDYSNIDSFEPATVDSVSAVQDFCLKNPLLYNLCYKTPFYQVLYRGAKLIKNVRRYFKRKNF